MAFATAQVHRIPAARPKRVVPTRQRHWLLLRDGQGQILLEQRPPSGIWGGLYALPEADELSPLLTRFALHAGQLQMLKRIEHSFTHFKLQAQVWTTRLGEIRQVQERPQEHWGSIAAARALGLPAPLRRLLDGMD
jgi:A/G-specific adenine glycosylase